MNVIRPNCRVQFTAEDIEFILSVLQPDAQSAESLVTLLTDAETRDLILDNEALLHAILERRNCLRISTHFYFYILVRQVFRRSGIEHRDVADYVAEMLAEFSQARNLECRLPGQNQPLEYFVDMLAALQSADEATAFYLRAHIGNRSLFITGVFPDHIRQRVERRGAPDLRYYEALGRENYLRAGDHHLARKYEVAEVFHLLGEQFETTRKALNDLGDRLLTLGDGGMSIQTLLHAVCNPQRN